MRISPYLKETLKDFFFEEIKNSGKSMIKLIIYFVIVSLTLLFVMGIASKEMYSMIITYFGSLLYATIIILFLWFAIRLSAKLFRIVFEFYELRDIADEDDDELYRDIIKGYSPAVLSYLDDYNLEVEKDISATILMLQIKRKIEIRNNEIILIDENSENLMESEKVILDCLCKCDSLENMKKTFAMKLYDDLKCLNLIEDGQMDFRFKKIASTGLLICTILLFLFTKMEIEISGILCALALCGYIFFGELLMAPSKFKLTEKGKKIKANLKGLREFLKEYSSMEEKSINEINLWDEYYICSVILGDNKVALKELENLKFNRNKSV